MKKGEGGARASLFVELSLLLAVFFFGTNFVAVKYVVADVPPLLFAATRFTLAGLLLVLLARLLEPIRFGRKDVLPMLGLGAVGVGAAQPLLATGVGITTAANSALIFSTAPIWGMLLAFALGFERPRPRGVAGLALALLGVGLVVSGGLSLGGGTIKGDLLVLGAAICWGCYTVLSLPLLERHPPLSVAAYPMLAGGLAIFPVAALFSVGRLPDLAALDRSVWGAAIYSLLFSAAFGYAAWQRGVRKVGANRVLVYQYLVTLIGVSAGIVLLGEGFGPEKVLGAVILLAGVYLARSK